MESGTVAVKNAQFSVVEEAKGKLTVVEFKTGEVLGSKCVVGEVLCVLRGVK